MVEHEIASARRTTQLETSHRIHKPFAAGERQDWPDLIFVSASLNHFCNIGFATGWLIQAVVVHVALISWPDMLQQAEEELFHGEL